MQNLDQPFDQRRPMILPCELLTFLTLYKVPKGKHRFPDVTTLLSIFGISEQFVFKVWQFLQGLPHLPGMKLQGQNIFGTLPVFCSLFFKFISLCFLFHLHASLTLRFLMSPAEVTKKKITHHPHKAFRENAVQFIGSL